MQISNNQMNKILSLYAQQSKATAAKGKTTDPSATAKPAAQRDELVLSDRAREIQLAMKAAKAAPDIREERVQALKEQIQSGTYSVPAEDVARMMLNRAAVDKLIDNQE